MSSAGVAAWLAERWVAIYTRRLPAHEARQRRDEIASDLWEHQTDSDQSGVGRTSHNLQVIERVLSGIPADLSWRRGIQRSQVRPERGDPMNTEPSIPRRMQALIIVASLAIVAPVPFLALLGSELDSAELLWVLGSLALSGVLGAGLVLRTRAQRPTLSTALLVIGAFAPSAAWFWMPPAYLLTAAVIVMALVTLRSRPVMQPQPT